jgi:SAM-dependent methyltransferase
LLAFHAAVRNGLIARERSTMRLPNLMTTPSATKILQPEDAKLHGQERYLEAINRTVAPGDGMYKGDDAYYLGVGANALRLVRQALAAAGRDAGQIKRLLDYACGFGRVLRWLQAGFPQARLVAADTDSKAVFAVQEIFAVDAFVLDLNLQEEIGREFDLIWIGSLATHLPEDQLRTIIARLGSLLSAKGLMVATAHGPYVANRIARGEKTYGLDPAGVARLVTEYRRDGYGFSAYPSQRSYGVSVCTASKLMSLLEGVGLQPIFYRERGWVRHQDCVAMLRAP